MPYLLIIGAKSDIAMECARIYSENGYDLYLTGRNIEKLNDFKKDLEIRSNQNIQLLELDVIDFKSHDAFYDNLEIKPIGVITVAGYLGTQKEAQNDFKQSKQIIETNYTGIVSLLNIISNDFEKRKKGFIVGISSVAGDRGRKSNYIYGSAKAGLTTYLSGLRNRLYSSSVSVLTVKPGFVNTKMTSGMDLPQKLTAEPTQVAEDIFKAQQKKKNVIYTQSKWRLIMLIIKSIPEFIFKKLSI